MPKDKTADFFMPQGPKTEKHIYTVSELTQDIKLVLESAFTEIWVEGEVSGISRIPTGTLFFNLKDSASILKCVIFPSCAEARKFELKDGIKVICSGRIGVYERYGNYQLYVQKIEPKGIGSLQLALEQLKERLEKEGLFSAEHKKPIPYLPGRIGLVTSAQGAAVKDILQVLDTRFRDVHIILNSVRVQGEGAKEEIAQAIKDFNLYNQSLPKERKIEVLIVGRGGGSIEDLWAFNEEIVARAIYNSKIPVISAVGHERDWTIADLAADLRAPTPSMAAERVVPKKEELRERLGGLSQDLKKAFLDSALNFQETIDDYVYRMKLSLQHASQFNSERMNAAMKKLALLSPSSVVRQHKIKIEDLARQIYVRVGHFIQLKEARFLKASEKISSLSPLNILGRGYSITFTLPTGQAVKDARQLKAGDSIKTRLCRGEVISKITEVN